MKAHRWLLAIVGALALGVLAGGLLPGKVSPFVAQAHAQTPPDKPLRKLRGAYVTSLSYSPLFLALEKRYFEAEGIELQLDVVQSASDTIAFLGLGQFDVAFGNIGAPLFNAIDRNIDVKIVGGMSYYPADPATLSPAPIVIRKELADAGTVKSQADLKGRKVAFNARAGIIEYLMAGSIRQAGLTVADLDVMTIAFSDMAIALSTGAADAAIMPEPISTAARERGVGAVLVPNPVPGALATAVMFGKNLLVGSDTSAGTALLRALRRAGNELTSVEANMSDANVQIWSKYTKLPAPLIKKTAPYVFKTDLAVDADSLLDQQKYLVDTKRINRALALDRLIDRRFEPAPK